MIEPAQSKYVEGPVLGIETSGTMTGAALVAEARLLGECAVDQNASSQELLLSLIADLLKGHGLHPRQLRRIGISIGPGSFTGLRVGLASARAISFGADVGVVPVPSHQALALPLQSAERPVVVLTGLRRGLVFGEGGLWHDGEWVAWHPAECTPLSEVGIRLRASAERAGLRDRWLFVGEAVDSVLSGDSELSGRGGRAPGFGDWRRPAAIAYLASHAVRAELRGVDLEHLAPSYLRDADAKRPSPRP